jgi:phosphopantothenoylcysteine decarboxylase / phosphopantothenate---cysteine ligase
VTGSSGSEIVLGVSGGIAAYKSCEILRGLTESGHHVTVVPTASALRFVGKATWEALSGRQVHTDLWENVSDVPHVRIGQQADLILIAPATADLIARAAHGLADDLLTNTLLTTHAPVMMAPAMHTEMWLHSATVANVATLRSRGVLVLEPATGRLTGADSGPGRLPEPEEILAQALALLNTPRRMDLAGRRVVVTAGGTREPIDPVRFLGNRSSGIQGYAMAAAAAIRGAEVELVSANVSLTDPAGVKVVRVETAEEMAAAVTQRSPQSDVVVMAAAVADFRPLAAEPEKVKKESLEELSLRLVRNPDILSGLVQNRSEGQIIVGFAAETGSSSLSALDHAREKLSKKGCDLLVFNDVSGDRVFGKATTEAVILIAGGEEIPVPAGSKDTLAHAVWDQVALRLP